MMLGFPSGIGGLRRRLNIRGNSVGSAVVRMASPDPLGDHGTEASTLVPSQTSMRGRETDPRRHTAWPTTSPP
jgi:hypothetical protein